MPLVFAFTFGAVFALLALVTIALFAREVVARLTAGPVRFRLATASAASPWAGGATSLWDPLRGLRLRGVAAYGWVRMFALLAMLCIMLSLTSRDQLFVGSRLMLIISLFLCAISFRLARRDVRWWLVLASGLFTAATAAVVLAVESRALQAGGSWAHGSPEALLLVGSALLLVVGAALVQDSILGTRVRERGVEIFCTTQPWSRIVVKGWREREGAFALNLTLLPPKLFGVRLEVEKEITVPVSASQRPTLEDFLSAHTATAG